MGDSRMSLLDLELNPQWPPLPVDGGSLRRRSDRRRTWRRLGGAASVAVVAVLGLALVQAQVAPHAASPATGRPPALSAANVLNVLVSGMPSGGTTTALKSWTDHGAYVGQLRYDDGDGAVVLSMALQTPLKGDTVADLEPDCTSSAATEATCKRTTLADGSVLVLVHYTQTVSGLQKWQALRWWPDLTNVTVQQSNSLSDRKVTRADAALTLDELAAIATNPEVDGMLGHA